MLKVWLSGVHQGANAQAANHLASAAFFEAANQIDRPANLSENHATCPVTFATHHTRISNDRTTPSHGLHS